MRRAIEAAHAGHWPEAHAIGTVTLDFDGRHRRRVKLVTDEGGEVLLDLPRAAALRDGDGLRCEDGGWVRVRAAKEAVAEVSAEKPGLLLRLAWHIGNRHLPAEIAEGWIRIRPDHVIEEMLAGLGAVVRRVEAAFQPEGGAYEAQGHHRSVNEDVHAHAHAHAHEVRHAHPPSGGEPPPTPTRPAQEHAHVGQVHEPEPDHSHDHPHDHSHEHPHDHHHDHSHDHPHDHSHEPAISTEAASGNPLPTGRGQGEGHPRR